MIDPDHEVISINDNQAFLRSAVQCKNIHRFRLALLLNGVSPDAIDDETHLSIFEKCCKTPGYHEFIKECLRWGCDINKINPHYKKKPLNYAAESGDVENIKVLLEDPLQKIHIGNDEQTVDTDLSPLHQLATNLNTDNYENIFKCLKELIDRHLNVNIPNADWMTPLLTIANKNIPLYQRECIIKYFLENSQVDLDTYRDGETRLTLSRLFPHLALPEKMSEKRNWDFIRLITALRDCEETEFLVGLKKFVNQVEAAEGKLQEVFRERFFSETLLMVAAKNGLARAAEELLRFGADVNNYPMNIGRQSLKKPLNEMDESSRTKSPLELACIYGNWNVLELFLKCPNISIGNAPLLINVVKNIGEFSHTKSCDYKKCFYLLLNYPQIDIDQKDTYGCTALHAAVKYNNQTEVLALLKKGAYIGTLNRVNEFPITDIDANILEIHFNSCITTNGLRPGDDNYEIRFKYGNLVPLSVRKCGKMSSKNAKILQCTDEMAPIEYMAKSTELKHLVKHPLIASFLFLKWHKLALVFYTNFICYTVYCLAMIFYLLFCYGQDSSKGIAAILYLISALGALYVLVREIGQLILSPSVYVRNKENYLEIVLIVTTIFVLMNIDFDESTRRTIAAFTILLAVTEFFLLTGSLPVLSFSTHLVMLKTVSRSFAKGLLLYSIILIAFALCFYTLLGGINANGDDVIEFNNFVHPGVAIIKAVVMLTGEFDASNIKFKQNGISYLVFVAFAFLISTVLSNLLNGLAISDTSAIKSEAELMNFIYRAKLMARYEKILLGKVDNVCCNYLLRKWSSSLMNLFPDFLPLNMLTVLPNSNNQVVIPISSESLMKLDNIEETTSSNYRQLEFSVRALNCCFGIKCSRMEVKIVKYAKHVLDIQYRNIEDESNRQEMQQRMVRIEERINDMYGKLETVYETLTKV